MDKIWYRNPSKSEVIGRCGGDEKNPEWPRRTDKSRTLYNKKKAATDGHMCSMRYIKAGCRTLLLRVEVMTRGFSTESLWTLLSTIGAHGAHYRRAIKRLSQTAEPPFRWSRQTMSVIYAALTDTLLFDHIVILSYTYHTLNS